MTKEEILEKYETYVTIGQPHNTTPIFLKENVLLAMEEYAQTEVNKLALGDVSNQRELLKFLRKNMIEWDVICENSLTDEGIESIIKIEMTPKEKAKELIEKFSKYAHWDNGASNNDFNSANCAIIACDELILQSDDANFGGFKLYWQAVKSELLSF